MSRRKKRRGAPRKAGPAGPGPVRADAPARPAAADSAPPTRPRQPEPPPVEPAAPAHHRPPSTHPRTPAAAPQAGEHVVPRVHHPVAATAPPPEPVPDAHRPPPVPAGPGPRPDPPVRERDPRARRPAPARGPSPRTPEEAFDLLYGRCAGALVRQAELLTGDAAFARLAVARAFDLAWQRWPEVACDSDPVGWVRAAAYEYALAPWQDHLPGWLPRRLTGRRPRPRTPDDPVAAALLELPPVRRRAVLLHDGVGLELPDAAAEIEASTVSAAGRVALAREELAQAVPAAADAVPARLSALLDAEAGPLPPPERVRDASERTTRRRTAAAYALACAVALVALVVAVVGPGTGSRAPHRDAVPRRPHGAPHDAPNEPPGDAAPDAPHDAPRAGAAKRPESPPPPSGWTVRVPMSPAYVPEAGYTDGAGPHPGKGRRRAVEP